MKADHIVVIRLSSVGDVVLATPVAERLRGLHPGARITWVADPGFLDLVRNNPHVDAAVGFDYTGTHRGPAGIRRLARELSPANLVIDLQHKVRSVLLTAYLRPDQRKVLVKRRGFGLVRALVGRDAILRAPHQVERYLSVLNGHGKGMDGSRPSLRVDARDRERARRLRASWGGTRPVMGLFPGARHATKRWPVRHVAGLVALASRAGIQVVLLGGESEEGLARGVLTRLAEPIPVCTQGSLGLLAGIIEGCDVVVSPDSGPAHMAAALGIPVVALFGPTSPERWAPRGDRSRVVQLDLPCSPCSNHGGAACPVGTLECMERLEPAQVLDAALAVVAGR